MIDQPIKTAKLRRQKREAQIRYAKKHPERVKEQQKRSRQNHRERVNAASRKWRKENPDKVKAGLKRWHQEHPEKRKQYLKRWRERNPEKAAASARIRERRRLGITNPTGETKHGPCQICQRDTKLHCDHNHDTGLQRGWLCMPCNVKLDWAVKYAAQIRVYLARSVQLDPATPKRKCSACIGEAVENRSHMPLCKECRAIWDELNDFVVLPVECIA